MLAGLATLAQPSPIDLPPELMRSPRTRGRHSDSPGHAGQKDKERENRRRRNKEARKQRKAQRR
jgi:hypothetical protein